MNLLKSFFPLSYKFSDTVANLVIGILIYLFAGAIICTILGWLSLIPILGIAFSLVGTVAGIYCLAGIVIEVLLFADVLK